MDTEESESWQIRRIGPAASCRKVLSVMKLKLGLNRFGRSVENEFFLDSIVLKNFISRQHAEIKAEKKENGEIEFLLQEKGLNGTFINDVRIKGTHILKEGDKITFGHTNGYKIEPGQYSQQPHSEFQFIFERCAGRDISSKRGLDSVEYHQTRACCGTRKLPASPDYDRSECCDNMEKHVALKHPSPRYLKPKVPPLSSTLTLIGKENESANVKLKNDNTLISAFSLNHLRKSIDSPGVPDIMQEVEVHNQTNTIPIPYYGDTNCVNESIIEVNSLGQCKVVASSTISTETPSHVRHFNIAEVQNSENRLLKPENDDELRKNKEIKSQSDNSAIKTLSDVCIKLNCPDTRIGSKDLGPFPSSAKSSYRYDECDGDLNGTRNIWNVLSNSSSKRNKNQSLNSETTRECDDQCCDDKQMTQANRILTEGRAIGADNLEDSDTSLQRNQDVESHMYSEDSDSKSSDVRPNSLITQGLNKKRKKKRFGPARPKRSRVIMKDDEKLEDGVEWYEVETCASFDCNKPSDRRVQWVQCDDCDKWFHTGCVGCRYDDVKDSQMEFHCGCV